MKPLFDYIHSFQFKNFFALPLTFGLLYLMENVPALHDSCLVLLTLVVKYYYDTGTASAKKDETISQALSAAQQLPAVSNGSSPIVGRADNVTVDNTQKGTP